MNNPLEKYKDFPATPAELREEMLKIASMFCLCEEESLGDIYPLKTKSRNRIELRAYYEHMKAGRILWGDYSQDEILLTHSPSLCEWRVAMANEGTESSMHRRELKGTGNSEQWLEQFIPFLDSLYSPAQFAYMSHRVGANSIKPEEKKKWGEPVVKHSGRSPALYRLKDIIHHLKERGNTLRPPDANDPKFP